MNLSPDTVHDIYKAVCPPVRIYYGLAEKLRFEPNLGEEVCGVMDRFGYPDFGPTPE